MHSFSLGRLTASEFKFNRSALGCAVAPLLVSPIPGPHPGNMIQSGSKGIHPYQATPPHHIVRGYPTGVLHKVDPPITCILQDGVGTPSRTLLTKIIKPPDVVWSYISGSDLPGDSFFSPHWSWRFDVRAHHDRQRPAHAPRKWKHCFSLHRRGIKQRPQFAHTMPWQSPATTAYEMYVNQQTLGPSPRTRRRNCCRHSEGC